MFPRPLVNYFIRSELVSRDQLDDIIVKSSVHPLKERVNQAFSLLLKICLKRCSGEERCGIAKPAVYLPILRIVSDAKLAKVWHKKAQSGELDLKCVYFEECRWSNAVFYSSDEERIATDLVEPAKKRTVLVISYLTTMTTSLKAYEVLSRSLPDQHSAPSRDHIVGEGHHIMNI